VLAALKLDYRQCALMAFKDRQDVEVKPTSCYLHGFKADVVISVAVKDFCASDSQRRD